MTITNNTAAVSRWSLTFCFAGGQKLNQGRNAEWSRSGTTVTAADQSYSGALATGLSVGAGFLGSWSGSNPSPSSFELNGMTCNVDADPSPAPTATSAPIGPPDTGDGTPPVLQASGNRLVDADGTTRRPLGVNRSGGEFMYVRGHGQYTGNSAGCSDVHATATTTQAWQRRRDRLLERPQPVAGVQARRSEPPSRGRLARPQLDQVMKWFDHRGRSYPGWTWNTWNCTSGPALISGYVGTPTAYGIGLRDHPRSLDG